MDMLQGILGGIRPAVVALIGSAGISILQTAFWGVSGKMVISDTSWLMVGIFVVCVILLRKVKMNPIWVMVLAGVMKVLVAMERYKSGMIVVKGWVKIDGDYLFS